MTSGFSQSWPALPGAVVLARDCTTRGTLQVTGADRREWLNGLLSCDVTRALPGQAVRGLLLDRLGKIQSDLWVVDATDSLLLSLSPGTLPSVQAELSRRLIMEEAELTDISAEVDWYFVAASLDAISEQAGLISAASLDLLGTGLGTVVAVRRGSVLPFTLWSDAAWDVVRLRAGLGEYGADFGPQDRPHEAALDRVAVARNKGCYLGQEVVCMQDMRGKVKHSLRGFALSDAEVTVAEGAQLFSAEALAGPAVGEVKSAAFDAEAGEWLLLARVQLASLDHAARIVLAGSGTALRLLSH